MVYVLFDFLMHRHAAEDWIILLEFKTLGVVLAVLRGDVARSTGQTAVLHFGAFKNYLHPIAFYFLCHGLFSG